MLDGEARLVLSGIGRGHVVTPEADLEHVKSRTVVRQFIERRFV